MVVITLRSSRPPEESKGLSKGLREMTFSRIEKSGRLDSSGHLDSFLPPLPSLPGPCLFLSPPSCYGCGAKRDASVADSVADSPTRTRSAIPQTRSRFRPVGPRLLLGLSPRSKLYWMSSTSCFSRRPSFRALHYRRARWKAFSASISRQRYPYPLSRSAQLSDLHPIARLCPSLLDYSYSGRHSCDSAIRRNRKYGYCRDTTSIRKLKH